MPGLAGVKVKFHSMPLHGQVLAVQDISCAAHRAWQGAGKALAFIGKIGGQQPVAAAGQGAQHAHAACGAGKNGHHAP